jgi:ferredoxin--NADP+ reductase
MTPVGTPDTPLRVAVIGSGPAAFYTAEHLFARDDLDVRVDMFERLPTPFGLVRFGVAPDHAKIKSVTRVYDRIAKRPGFRFFGNVEYGAHFRLDDLRRHYHAVCFATGAQTDRRMGIPGEDLGGSHTATEFVAWYNGHPDYRHHVFDLTAKRAAVVGVGNVAVDVARVLCRTPEELEQTDIAPHALEALRGSAVKEVVILGRRGPAQAAFTNAEVKELGELEGADVAVVPEEVTLDALSEAQVAKADDRALTKKMEILQGLSGLARSGKDRLLTLRFLVSPVELIDRGDGRVGTARIVKNTLYESKDGSLRPKATDEFEEFPVDLVFRSVGYRGVALPDIPFRDDWGTVPNDAGRVLEDDGTPMTGVYVAGWIKRGPSGVIGTNKPCAAETVERMVDDARSGTTWSPEHAAPEATQHFVEERQPHAVSWEGWQRLDAHELAQGKAAGRPRLKLTDVQEMLDIAG